jgi:N-formylglutamate amidohydrolase
VNNIKLVIDLHGSSKDKDFDIEFGTLNNLSADYSTIKELEESFKENNINNIKHNNPFKGGAITQYLYNKKDIDVIQLEINYKYRDYSNLDIKLENEYMSDDPSEMLENEFLADREETLGLNDNK